MHSVDSVEKTDNAGRLNYHPVRLRLVLLLTAIVPLLVYFQAEAAPAPAKMHPLLAGDLARPLRYWPVDGAFVITNGAEYFNRPLYCMNSGFRIDGGDKPEWSLYLPGRGGNLRLGIRTPSGTKWLDAADKIVTRYGSGMLDYEINDRLLGAGTLRITVVPQSQARGGVWEVTADATGPLDFVWAFGGANGMRGKRGGDIGCESEPVGQLFQLRPDECKGNQFEIVTNGLILHARVATIAGVMPTFTTASKAFVADARKWASLDDLLASKNSHAAYPVAVGEVAMNSHTRFFMAFQLASGDIARPLPKDADLSGVFELARQHQYAIARRVSVSTPDPFINTAVPALNIAADAIWDDQQQSFMHGAVAWRMRLLGWRGPYAGDALGWHDRTAAHFAGFAREQNTDPVPETIPPADENSNLSRNETALHSNGDLTHTHYDMNLVAVDAFFRHLLWTGDTNYAAEMWPVIQRHFDWEHRLFRREFGGDQLPLYEAYAAIWASDNLSYDGGGTAHASAYNYYANKMAARVARLLGRDPAPYNQEADLILRGMNKYLWLADQGCFAECKDYLGEQFTHDSPALWTFYTTMDSEVPTPGQAWQMSRWVDAHIAHIPIEGPNVADENLFTLPSSNWMPYEWSLNNVVMAEAAHTSLAYWEANRPATAFKLFKGELMDSMFLGLCPGNLGAMTAYDAARGESQRDFGDAIGINARALVEGLFGVKPDALAGELAITPGFPEDWQFAKMSHPDFNFEFRRDDLSETYTVESKFSKPMKLILKIPAYTDSVGDLTVNDAPATYGWVPGLYGIPRLEIEAGTAEKWQVRVTWKGQPPATRLLPPVPPVTRGEPVTTFDWNQRFPAGAIFETVSLAPIFNDRVTQIFKHKYRSPRSPFCSLAMPDQGIGGWADDRTSFDVDDTGLRAVASRNGGTLILPDGVPLRTPADAAAKNIAFTSQWDNFPREVSVPLSGKSSHAFLLMAGSTGPLQSQFDNGEVVVTYADGSAARLPLRNPVNWWPIDQDYFIDDFAFRRPESIPLRVDLATGKVRLLNVDEFKGQGSRVPGGAATVLDLPLDPHKALKSLTVHALANEVVIGLMSLTLERE